MLISDRLIKYALKDKTLKVSFEPESDTQLNIGPNSIDVTLAPNIYTFDKFLHPPKHYVIDPSKDLEKSLFEAKFIPFGGYILKSGECILASTQQAFDCSECGWVQHYEGRSTMGRLFVMSHVTAGFGDFGFKGAFTLEIVNLSPYSILLQEGMRIGQVYFEAVTSVDIPYAGYTQTDFNPQLPRLGKGRF